MYDEYNRKCPKHPTLAHPCQICGELSRDVSADTNPTALVKGVNWQNETNTPYNTPQPRPIRRFNPSEVMLEELGAESGDRRYGAREVPPPPPRVAGIIPVVSTTQLEEFDQLEFDPLEFD